MNAYQRWGLLLGTLSEISDVERQVVIQSMHPASFVPDELMERWFTLYRDGRGLARLHLPDIMLATLDEFDYTLSELLEIMPEQSEDKEEYIRYNEVWSAVRDMAEVTLQQIALLTRPEEAAFSPC